MKLTQFLADVAVWTAARIEWDEAPVKDGLQEAALATEQQRIIEDAHKHGITVSDAEFVAAAAALRPILSSFRNPAAVVPTPAGSPGIPSPSSPTMACYTGAWPGGLVKVVGWTAAFLAVGAFTTIIVAVVKHWAAAKILLAVTLGVCTTLPPLWFFLEYFFLYRKYGAPGSFDIFKQGQQVAIAVWAGLTAALLGLSLSDWVKSDPGAYRCDIVASQVKSNAPNAFQLSCTTAGK